ncbi:hypothetical protein D3C81_1243560 [compost metagenome]
MSVSAQVLILDDANQVNQLVKELVCRHRRVLQLRRKVLVDSLGHFLQVLIRSQTASLGKRCRATLHRTGKHMNLLLDKTQPDALGHFLGGIQFRCQLMLQRLMGMFQ